MKPDRDRVRAKAMFAQMSPKEKRAHILRYYWPHMAAGLFVLMVAVALAVTCYNNAKTRDYVYVGIQQEYYEQLQPRVEQLAAEADWPEGLNYMSYPSTSSPDGMGSMQMVMYLSADQLDAAVCDERTTTLLQQDETMRCQVWPLEDTALGQGHTADEPLFLVTFADTARGEKAVQFQQLLAGSAPVQSN
ncbi:MAG: hypothetical protein J6Q14_04350 [Oscillospiraceae bacterium]|nr:hypothetical protein [Oscillospiraceae bacterium]